MRDSHVSATRRQVIAAMLTAAAGTGAFETVSAQSTPVASPAVDRTLDELVRIAAPRTDGSGELFWYCDLARQFAAFGIDRSRLEELSDFPVLPVTRSLYSPSRVLRRMFEYEEGALPGFPPYQAERVAVAGPPDAPVEVWSGGFSTATLPELLASLEYIEQESVGEQRIWATDPEADAVAPELSGRYGTVAMVGEDAVLFAPDVDLAEETLRRWNGEAPSLADDAGVREVMATVPAEMASFVLATGEALLLDGMLERMPAMAVERLETDLAATGRMPPIDLILFGGTAGALYLDEVADWAEWTDRQPPKSHLIARMLADDAGVAAEVTDIVKSRIDALQSLQSGRPYREVMPVVEGFEDPDSGDGVAALDFDALASWHRLWLTRDMLPFAVEGSPEDG